MGGDSALKLTDVLDQLLRLAPTEQEAEAKAGEGVQRDWPPRLTVRDDGSDANDRREPSAPETTNGRTALPDWILRRPDHERESESRPSTRTGSITAPTDAPPLVPTLDLVVSTVAHHLADSTAYERALEEHERQSRMTVAPFVETLGLGFHLGAAVDRIAFASLLSGKAGPVLREALWLIERYIEFAKHGPDERAPERRP